MTRRGVARLGWSGQTSRRDPGPGAEGGSVSQPPLSRLWDAEHDQHVARRLLELLEPEFSAHTWQAFRRQALDGVPPIAVAAEMATTVNAVLVAKSKVLSRLRHEARGLLD